MNASILVAVITSIAAVIVAGISYTGSRHAQRDAARASLQNAQMQESAQRATVEAQAYERARVSYEKIVKDLEHQQERNQRTIDLMQAQMDRVAEQLSKEQDHSHTLRAQVRSMQDQIEDLRRENEEFRSIINEHKRATGALENDLRRAGIDVAAKSAYDSGACPPEAPDMERNAP